MSHAGGGPTPQLPQVQEGASPPPRFPTPGPDEHGNAEKHQVRRLSPRTQSSQGGKSQVHEGVPGSTSADHQSKQCYLHVQDGKTMVQHGLSNPP